MIPKVVRHLYDPGIQRHIFWMADGIVLQCDHNWMANCGTKEKFQEEMEKLYVKVRDAGGGPTPGHVQEGIPTPDEIRTGTSGSTESEGGGIGNFNQAYATDTGPLHGAGANEFGTDRNVGS